MRKLTQEEFIQRTKEVHGDRYDYGESIYVNSRTKIKVKCYKHGVFELNAHSHLNGIGCRKCGSESSSLIKTKSTNNFIKQALDIHGINHYNYDLVEYKRSDIKVKIYCNIENHGIFEQSPGNHLSGHGCPKCKSLKAKTLINKTTEEFIEEATKVHGKEHYDYSKVVYKGTNKKVIILCNIHQIEFKQLANNHLNGKNCPLCRYNASKSKQTKTQEQFLKEALAIHGNRYDYSETIYRGGQAKNKNNM